MIVLGSASHTSASPGWPLARFTSVQVTPAPVTFTVCFPVPGPSADTNANSNSSVDPVWNAGVVTVPLLVATTFTSWKKQIIGGAGLVTVTVIVGAVPTFPAGSVACAPIVCVPFGTVVVSQLNEYGDVKSGAPSGLPS